MCRRGRRRPYKPPLRGHLPSPHESLSQPFRRGLQLPSDLPSPGLLTPGPKDDAQDLPLARRCTAPGARRPRPRSTAEPSAPPAETATGSAGEAVGAGVDCARQGRCSAARASQPDERRARARTRAGTRGPARTRARRAPGGRRGERRRSRAQARAQARVSMVSTSCDIVSRPFSGSSALTRPRSPCRAPAPRDNALACASGLGCPGPRPRLPRARGQRPGRSAWARRGTTPAALGARLERRKRRAREVFEE